MLKKLSYICLVLLIVSCERIFVNGDLDGMWRLKRVEVAGSVEYPDTVFYSFQRHLVMMGIYSETEHPKNWYMARFRYEGDSIFMDNFYRYPGIDGVFVPGELENLHIYDSVPSFKVEHLSGEMLVLSSGDVQYTFMKW